MVPPNSGGDRATSCLCQRNFGRAARPRFLIFTFIPYNVLEGLSLIPVMLFTVFSLIEAPLYLKHPSNWSTPLTEGLKNRSTPSIWSTPLIEAPPPPHKFCLNKKICIRRMFFYMIYFLLILFWTILIILYLLILMLP